MTPQSFGERGYVYGEQFPEVCSAAVAVEQQHEITLGHCIVGNNRLLLWKVWTQGSFQKYVECDCPGECSPIVVDSDWRFDNLYGSHLQSQNELYHVSWWYYTLVIDLIAIT